VQSDSAVDEAMWSGAFFDSSWPDAHWLQLDESQRPVSTL
jgi:hypothetical protein